MKIFKQFLFLVLFGTSFSTSLFGQVRAYSNEFLNLGVGGRALGMGNAQVATADDVTAGYWNPAGLNNVKSLQLSFMHSEWFAGQGKFDYLGIAAPINADRATLGLTVLRFGVDDIPNTLYIVEPDGSINYDNLTTFSSADYAFIVSYAQLFRQFELGGNVKIIHRQVGSFANAWGFGIDLAGQYVTNTDWKFGANLRNVTTTINAWSFNFTQDEQNILAATDNVIPESSVELTAPELLVGAAKNFIINEDLSVLTEVDLAMTFDGKRNTLLNSKAISIDPRIGAELGYKDLVYLRAGFNNMQRLTTDDIEAKETFSIQPNLGVGINIKNFTIDYAFTGINNTDTGFFSHVFSIKLNWNTLRGSI